MTSAGFPEPAIVTLPIYRGDDLYAPFRLYTTADDGVTKDYYDLTGFTITAQVRRHVNDSDPLLELTVEIVSPQTGDDVGRFNVTATEDETAALPLRVARWDVQLDDGSTVRTWMRGPVPITGDVTREEGS